MVVWRCGITAWSGLYNRISCISDGNADYHRQSWNGVCRWIHRNPDHDSNCNVPDPQSGSKCESGGIDMVDWMIAGIVIAIIGMAIAYIVKAKKKGVKCIGCKSCSGNCSCHHE